MSPTYRVPTRSPTHLAASARLIRAVLEVKSVRLPDKVAMHSIMVTKDSLAVAVDNTRYVWHVN